MCSRGCLPALTFSHLAHRFPTVIIFASGTGIATAAALIESPVGVGTHISPRLRQDVRLYYAAPNRTSLCLADRFEQWEEDYKVVVKPTTSGFMDAWDGDDTLVYDPENTAAVILSECSHPFTIKSRLSCIATMPACMHVC